MKKICTVCQQEKELEMFEANARYVTGHMHQCKDCRYLKRIKRIEQDRKNINSYNRKRYRRKLEKDPGYEARRKRNYHSTLIGKINDWKRGAIQRGIAWELDEKDFDAMPLICHYTKRELTFEVGHYNSLSLDRIDSTKGYTKDNVVFCCKIVNMMKLDIDVKDFINWCKIIAANN